MPVWDPTDLALARLARRAGGGDKVAFRQLYRRLFPLVRGYVSRRVRVPADVDDLTARVFYRVVERLSEFDPARGTVRVWVLTMARNAIIDQLRARRPNISVDDGDGSLVCLAALPEAALLQDERARLVRELVEDLPSGVQEMLALRFGDGLRYGEIAVLLGTTEAAIKQRFSRTLRELRARSDRLEQEGATRYAT